MCKTCLRCLYNGSIDGFVMGLSIGLASGFLRALALMEHPRHEESPIAAIVIHAAAGAGFGVMSGFIHSFIRNCVLRFDRYG